LAPSICRRVLVRLDLRRVVRNKAAINSAPVSSSLIAAVSKASNAALNKAVSSAQASKVFNAAPNRAAFSGVLNRAVFNVARNKVQVRALEPQWIVSSRLQRAR
jgi:hypothetical protein